MNTAIGSCLFRIWSARATLFLLGFIASASVLQTRGQCVPPQNNLVSWWQAEGNANDSVDGNHGTLANGAAFASGFVGQAFSFDGVNDSVNVGNGLGFQSTESFSISAWIKPSAFGGFRGIVTKVGGATSYYVLELSGAFPAIFSVLRRRRLLAVVGGD